MNEMTSCSEIKSVNKVKKKKKKKKKKRSQIGLQEETWINCFKVGMVGMWAGKTFE